MKGAPDYSGKSAGRRNPSRRWRIKPSAKRTSKVENSRFAPTIMPSPKRLCATVSPTLKREAYSARSAANHHPMQDHQRVWKDSRPACIRFQSPEFFRHEALRDKHVPLDFRQKAGGIFVHLRRNVESFAFRQEQPLARVIATYINRRLSSRSLYRDRPHVRRSLLSPTIIQSCAPWSGESSSTLRSGYPSGSPDSCRAQCLAGIRRA